MNGYASARPGWDSDLVLPAPDGAPRYRRIVYREYMGVVKAAQLDDAEYVNFHTLRHTAASLWIKAGVDSFTVSRRLGHSKTSFTMDVYAHLLEGQQSVAAAALDHLLAR
jgi:integrase